MEWGVVGGWRRSVQEGRARRRGHAGEGMERGGGRAACTALAGGGAAGGGEGRRGTSEDYMREVMTLRMTLPPQTVGMKNPSDLCTIPLDRSLAPAHLINVFPLRMNNVGY